MVNGEISEVGSYEELLSHDGPFAQFLKTYLTQLESEDEEEDPEGKGGGEDAGIQGNLLLLSPRMTFHLG